MRNKTMAVIAAVSLALLPILGVAQGFSVVGVQVAPLQAYPVSNIVSAIDTDKALYIKYFPGATFDATAATTVAVEADGNLTFVVAAAAYTGFECPVSGALGGVVDVSDAACDTLGEVVDVINGTATSFATGYFRAVIAAGLRSTSSNDSFLADAADNEVLRPEGEAILWDTSTLDDVSLVLWNDINGAPGQFAGKRVNKNPLSGYTTVLLYASETITNAGTIGNFEAHCTVENYVDGGTSSEVDRIVYFEAGAATTATGKIDEFVNAGGLRCDDGKLWVTILASGADTTAAVLFATGYQIPRN